MSDMNWHRLGRQPLIALFVFTVIVGATLVLLHLILPSTVPTRTVVFTVLWFGAFDIVLIVYMLTANDGDYGPDL